MIELRGATLILLLAAAPSAAQDTVDPADRERFLLEAQVDGRTETLKIKIEDTDFASEGPVWWRGEISKLGTPFFRLHLRIPSGAEGSGAIVQVDAGGGQSFTFAAEAIGAEGLWTGLLPGGLAVLSLMGERRPDGLVLEIDQLSFEADTGTLYSTWGGVDETLQINDAKVPENVRGLAGPVGRLSFFSLGASRTCTGFLISEDTLLTNEHCINSEESCRTMVALFGYEYDSQNRLQFGRQFTCKGFDAARVNFELDASVVWLNGTPGADFGTVEVAGVEAEIEKPLFLIQHPGGEPKQVSFINCSALAHPVDGRAPETDMTHTCDTAGGSSGAPVFDASGRVVGLHHYGFAEGQVEEWTENRAVRLSRIATWIGTVAVPPQP